MRSAVKRTSLAAATVVAALLATGLTWSFGVPAERHLYYAVLPTEEQSFASMPLVKISRLSLARLDRCPGEATQPETPIGFLVGAYRGEPDQEWFQDALRALLRAGCDINSYNNSGLTPLMNAALFNHAWVQQHLLSSGADAAMRSTAVGRFSGLTAYEISTNRR